MGLRDRLRRQPRTPQELFAAEVAALVPRLVPGSSATVGDDFSLSITRPDGTPITMFLDNVFVESGRLTGDDREVHLQRAVLAMHPSPRPTTWAEAEPRLRPALRPATFAATIGRGGKPALREEFAPFLTLLAAIDDDFALSYVNEDDARAWGVGWEDVRTAAAAGLRQQPAELRMAEDRRGLLVLGPDGYASSWLAVPEAVEQMAAHLGTDDWVALVMTRDALEVLSADDPALPGLLAERLEEWSGEPRRISPVPYVLSGGGVVPWAPAAGHPCHTIVGQAGRVLAAQEYNVQKEAMEDLLEKAGDDTFLADVLLLADAARTVTSWARGVRALLPRVEKVVLVDLAAEEHISVGWDDLVRVAGPALVQEPGLVPPRWRVTDWPAPAVVDELRALGA